jgi:transcription elongation factor Elf1
VKKEKEELEQLFGTPWSFDCPLCDDHQSVVCELDEKELNSLKVVPKRMACTACGFVVRKSHPFLSEVLLQNQIAETRGQILKEYGLQ